MLWPQPTIATLPQPRGPQRRFGVGPRTYHANQRRMMLDLEAAACPPSAGVQMSDLDRERDRASLAPATLAEALAAALKHPVFVFAAQTLTLLAAMGFALSSLFNSFVFYQWHLSFMQVAAPADVLMSGIDAAGRIFAVVVIILFSILISDVFAAALWPITPHLFQLAVGLFERFTIPKAVGIVVLYVASISFGGLFAGVLFLSADYTNYILKSMTIFWLPYVASTAFLANFLVRGYVLFTNRLHSKFGVVSKTILTISAIVLTFLIIDVCNEFFKINLYPMIRLGYMDGLHYASPVQVGCDGRVMWMGERAIVVACGPPPHPHFAIISTQNAPGLVITDVPPARPSLAPATPGGDVGSEPEDTGSLCNHRFRKIRVPLAVGGNCLSVREAENRGHLACIDEVRELYLHEPGL